FHGCRSGRSLPAAVRLDERLGGERERTIRLLARPLRDGAALVRMLEGSRPVTGPALQLGQQEQDHGERSLIPALPASLLDVLERRSGRVQLVRPEEHASLAERWAPNGAQAASHSLEFDRAADRLPGDPLTSEEVMECGQRERCREHLLVSLALRQL